MILNLTNAGDEIKGGGFPEPDRAYRFTVEQAEVGQTMSGKANVSLRVRVTEGDQQGTGMFTKFMLPDGGKGDSIRLTLLRLLFLSMGVPENAMANLDIQQIIPATVGKTFVGYYEARKYEWQGETKTSHEVIGIKRENADAALTGSWSPRGKKAKAAPTVTTAAPTQATMFGATPAPTPAPTPAAGGFDNLFS